jgi:4-hydroxy-3-polyprenylbenzoate decarboxylase
MFDQNNIPPQSQKQFPLRLVVGISAASGAILGIRLLETLKSTTIETHLVLSASAHLTIRQETDWRLEDVVSLADVSYEVQDIGAAIASGSFVTLGMVVIPCSIKTLSAVANAFADDLLSRAADVTLKEGRPLVLVVREAPYHAGHLRLMSEATLSGAVIFPPVPAFYIHPHSVDDIINNTVGRVLARLGIKTDLYREWQGQSLELDDDIP